jgi:prolyl-tRNA editing enzyme YbaK/EbsC (Cys-tRNA(Pro) deacylase)
MAGPSGEQRVAGGIASGTMHRSDPIEQRVVDDLERLGADYETLDIDPGFADTAVFCEKYGYALEESANAILVASRKPEGINALCLGLATTRLDVNHTVRRLLEVRKLSFASPESTREVTGMEIGGVTPFGAPGDLRVLVDSAITALPRCIVGGGSRAMKVRVDPEVFARMDNVEVIEGLAA